MESKRVQNWFFGALFLLLFAAVARLFAPFFSALLWSSLLYVLFSPLYKRIVKRTNPAGRAGPFLRHGLAAVFSVLSVVLIVVPLAFVAIQLTRQLYVLVQAGLRWLESPAAQSFLSFSEASSFLREASGGALDIAPATLSARLSDALSGLSDGLIGVSSRVLKNIGLFFANLAFIVFSLYFFYVDGDYLLRLLVSAVPIRDDYAQNLIQKFRDITRNLLLGYFVVALFQGAAAFILFVAFGVKGALAFAALLTLCSFIPMLGAGIVWAPIGIARALSGDVAGGFLFLALCAFFVSTLDNFLRPLFLRDRIQLHPLIIFFSIVGGLSAFGFNGLVLGPLIVIFFLTVLDLFLAEHGIENRR